MSDLLTPQETAEVLRVHQRTLRRWRSLRYGPPSHRIGRLIRYRRADLDRWIERDAVDRARRPLTR